MQKHLGTQITIVWKVVEVVVSNASKRDRKKACSSQSEGQLMVPIWGLFPALFALASIDDSSGVGNNLP